MKEYFPDIRKIKYSDDRFKEGLCFRQYNADETIGGKTMKEQLKFSMAYWHTICAEGGDPFGAGTALRPWQNVSSPMKMAEERVYAAFELMQKLGIEYFCFHDRDIAPEGDSLIETNKNIDEIVRLIKKMMSDTGIKILWGTANLFYNPRFMHGASTSCNADVFAYSAAQVQKALEITKELTKHQYDFDVSSGIAFLKSHNLDKYFKFNVEANHATLAGHTFQHELMVARINGMLGSVDANQGDLLLGWDTDQFPTDLYSTTLCMYEVLKMGGL